MNQKQSFYLRLGKRLLDLFVAVVGLVLAAPVIGIIVLLVRLRLGHPVIFRQRRPGLHSEPFVIYKFRTMNEKRDDEGNLLPDVDRLTPLGRFLRSMSLDELPELINVIKGDMSLVGPRPLLMRYIPYYTLSERKRFEVLPGITGWAQVNGRNDAGWDKRLALDIWYVEHLSLGLDLRILAMTLWQVLNRKNVQVTPRTTMLDLDEARKNERRFVSSD
jgi:sugar transferase EpsL